MYCAAQSMLHCDYVHALCVPVCVRVCVCVCVCVYSWIRMCTCDNLSYTSYVIIFSSCQIVNAKKEKEVL